MVRARIMVLVLFTFSGCRLLLDSEEVFRDQHYILRQKDTRILEGPYRMKKALAPNRISVASGLQDMEVILRGCNPTGDEKLDSAARRLLSTVCPDDVYFRKDCTIHRQENRVTTVVYDPANRESVLDEQGAIDSKILTYTMPQLLNLLHGYCLLDHSDTNYPLYEVFLEAESLARKNRKGYWATHTEPPCEPTTETVSMGSNHGKELKAK